MINKREINSIVFPLALPELAPQRNSLERLPNEVLSKPLIRLSGLRNLPTMRPTDIVIDVEKNLFIRYCYKIK